jgi:hypothetical protein
MNNKNSQLPPRPQPLVPHPNEPQRDIPVTNKTASQGFGQPLAPGTRAPSGPFKAKYANSRNSGGKRRRTKTTKKRRTNRMRKTRRHR